MRAEKLSVREMLREIDAPEWGKLPEERSGGGLRAR
jgi:hypothetical protein